MAEKAKRAPNYFRIPAGTPSTTCDRCPATIYFIRTDSGKRMPVRADLLEGKHPAAGHDGRGISHFADCPAAAHFRKPRP